MSIPEEDLVALSEYLDGGLSEAEREAFEARLAEEPALKAELDAMRSMLEAMTGLGDDDDVDLRAGVERKLRRRSRGRFYSRRFKRERLQVELFLGVAVVAFAAIVLVSSPSSISNLIRADVPTEESAQRDDETADERLGAPSMEHRGTTLREHVYTIEAGAAAGAEGVEAALGELFDADTWQRQGDTWVIHVPRAERVDHVQALSVLGPVTRRPVERDRLDDTAVIEITLARDAP